PSRAPCRAFRPRPGPLPPACAIPGTRSESIPLAWASPYLPDTSSPALLAEKILLRDTSSNRRFYHIVRALEVARPDGGRGMLSGGEPGLLHSNFGRQTSAGSLAHAGELLQHRGPGFP